MTESIAVYVHFPFCLSICPYCDFDRQATGFDRVDVYLDAVRKEMRQYTGRGKQVHSIFFGGGTPSLMQASHLAAVIDCARMTFDVASDAEITVECNPGDADLQKLRAFKDAGANRF